MKSIDKLKRLTGEAITPIAKDQNGTILPASGRRAAIDDLRSRIDGVVARSAARARAAQEEAKARGNRALCEILEGEESENRFGRFFLAGGFLSGASRHGHRSIHDAFDIDMTAAGMLANNPVLGNYHSSDALFLDTETTGLSGGTGTMAFLIGLGWYEEGRFHVRQILARDFSEEPAALACLQEIAAQKKFLVTFNGKAFDVNLLAARFILNRMPSSLHELPHLDLLHPARRLLGHRLDNCRLSTLETDILGVEREGDVPGWEIPQRYFDWLRRRDPRSLADIFAHNRLDVISMTTLTAHLVDLLKARALKQHAHPDDYLAAARLLLKKARTEEIEKILEMLGENASAELSLPSKKKLANLCKRTGRLDEAVRIWRQVMACDPNDFYAVSELAKHLEHRARDYARAEALIEDALAGNRFFSEEEQEALSHRLKRLRAKAFRPGKETRQQTRA